MARNTPLLTVRQMLKAELGMAQVTNDDLDYELNTLISNKQQFLAGEFDWPFLRRRWDVTCTAATQFHELPTVDKDGAAAVVDFERPPRVSTLWGTTWQPVVYGITEEDYSRYDSYAGTTGARIEKWQFHDDSEFEVWPLVASAQTVRFTMQRTCRSLLTENAFDDEAPLDLDDLMVVYFVAAERLARLKQMDAMAKQQLAQMRLARVRAVYPASNKRVVLGGRDEEIYKEPVKIIAVA